MTRQQPPSVDELLTNYLRQQIQAQANGLGFVDLGEQAVPFDAVPVQPVDPQQAWSDATTAGLAAERWQVPPGWPTLVSLQEPTVAIALALGNYPQLVRELQPLLTGEALALRQPLSEPIDLPELNKYLNQAHAEPSRYLAAGVARLARQFDTAQRLLAQPPSATWQAQHANERAALAWHRGDHRAALADWLAQPDSVPVLFNRGMAALFLGESDLALSALDAVIAQLPDSSAWHHLARLYQMLVPV